MCVGTMSIKKDKHYSPLTYYFCVICVLPYVLLDMHMLAVRADDDISTEHIEKLCIERCPVQVSIIGAVSMHFERFQSSILHKFSLWIARSRFRRLTRTYYHILFYIVQWMKNKNKWINMYERIFIVWSGYLNIVLNSLYMWCARVCPLKSILSN